MANNSNLGAAKAAKNDEFYTQYADIQKEVNAYLAPDYYLLFPAVPFSHLVLFCFLICYLFKQVEQPTLYCVVVVVGTGDLVPDVVRAVGFEHFVI